MIIDSRKKEYKQTLNKIDRLTVMKLNEQITKEEYTNKRNELLKDKDGLKEFLYESDSRIDSWLELTEKAFDSISNIREIFNSADCKDKANILNVIGKRITTKDGKLNIEPNDWLEPIGAEYPILEKEYKRLEPAETIENIGKMEL